MPRSTSTVDPIEPATSIKSRGYRIELGEIQFVLIAHPAVLECAVVAVPDPQITNVIRAVVVADGSVSNRELLRHCAARLPGYMLPNDLQFIGAPAGLHREDWSPGARDPRRSKRGGDDGQCALGICCGSSSSKRSKAPTASVLSDDYPLIANRVIDSLAIYQLVGFGVLRHRRR